MNWHSKLFGNDPADSAGQRLRGQRVFCCDRGQRGGCGRTFAIFSGQVIPNHTVSASALWSLLEQLVKGQSIQGAARALGLPFALETVYHLLHRLRARLAGVRSLLAREQAAPESLQTDPLLQTVEHLRLLFPNSPCPPADFQLHFQRPLLE